MSIAENAGLIKALVKAGDGDIIAAAMKSHTVPRFLLDQFAYDDPVTGSRRLWQYAKDREPWGFASPTSATRIEHHFEDPADPSRESRVENRLNNEFENPVHQFIGQLRYRTFVLSRLQVRQLTRYLTLLFNRSENRRRGTREQIQIAIDSTHSLLANEDKMAQIAGRWTVDIIRLGHPLQRNVTIDEVRSSGEKMIAMMETQDHLQTTYVDAMERAMASLDDNLDNGQWNQMHTNPENPFIIGDAPVVTWQRLENGSLIHGQGFATPNVEAMLPVAPTTCLHILPAVQRTRQVKPPSVGEVNEAQAAYATSYCYAHVKDSILNGLLQPRFGTNRIGINVFSVRHRKYEDAMFELLMNGGQHVDPSSL